MAITVEFYSFNSIFNSDEVSQDFCLLLPYWVHFSHCMYLLFMTLYFTNLVQGEHGQLGHGDKVNKVKPTLVQALDSVVLQQITCGWSHSVALTSQGEVYTWGNGLVKIVGALVLLYYHVCSLLDFIL